MSKFSRGTYVKSFRNCCGTTYRVVTAHRDGTLSIVPIGIVGGQKHRVQADLLYAAYLPDRFIPLDQPLPSGRM